MTGAEASTPTTDSEAKNNPPKEDSGLIRHHRTRSFPCLAPDENSPLSARSGLWEIRDGSQTRGTIRWRLAAPRHYGRAFRSNISFGPEVVRTLRPQSKLFSMCI